MKGIHFSEIRTAIAEMRTALGLPPATYSNPPGPANIVRAAHLTEARQNIK